MKTISLGDLERMTGADSVDTVLAVFPDQQGRLAGKRYTARTFLSQAREGWEGCDYLLGCDVENEPLPGYSSFSWERGYGDFMVRPDLDTLVLIPWLDRTAMVLGDVEGKDHQPLPVAPRQILQAQVRRAEKMGLTIRIASELEFYVFNDSYEQAGARRYQDLDTSGKYIQDYHILQTTKEEKLMQPLRRYFDALGFEVENSKGEWGPGQEELNLGHEEPVEMADRHSIFKHGVKEVAALMGMSVTFMAKWNTNFAGNSCHLHSSIWDKKTGAPLGWEPKGPAHMSAKLGSWTAGQLELGRELSVFYAPYVNSYRRYQAGSCGPTRLVAGVDNRTCGMRILGHSAKAIRWRTGAGRRCHPSSLPQIAAAYDRAGLKFEDSTPQRLRRSRGARSAQDSVRGCRAARWLEGRASRLRRRGGRPLREHRLAGATGLRSAGDGSGSAAEF